MNIFWEGKEMYRKITDIGCGRCGDLLVGRVAFATANLKGGAFSPAVFGRIGLYSSDAGIIMFSEASELPYNFGGGAKRQRYELRIENQNVSGKICENLPYLLGNCGYAWGVTIIHPLCSDKLIGSVVSVISDRGQLLAEGKIQRVS